MSKTKPLASSFRANASISDLNSFFFQFAIKRISSIPDCSGNVSFTVSCENDRPWTVEYSAQQPFAVSRKEPVAQVVMHAKPVVREGDIGLPPAVFLHGMILLLLLIAITILLFTASHALQKLWPRSWTASWEVAIMRVKGLDITQSQPLASITLEGDLADSEDEGPDILLANGARFTENEPRIAHIQACRDYSSVSKGDQSLITVDQPTSTRDVMNSRETSPMTRIKHLAKRFRPPSKSPL